MSGALTRADMLARTPAVYLAQGWLTMAGTPRPELRDIDASAAATQFLAAELSPQELGFTFEAIRLLLPEHDEPEPGARIAAVIEEALQTVVRAIQQPINQGLLQWLNECAVRIGTAREIDAFIEHMGAVTRQYALVVALQPAEPLSSSV